MADENEVTGTSILDDYMQSAEAQSYDGPPPRILTDEEQRDADRYVQRRLAGEDVPENEIPEMFRSPAPDEPSPEEMAAFEERMRIFHERAARQRMEEEGIAILANADPATLEKLGKWGEREAERRDEEAASELRKDIVRELYPTKLNETMDDLIVGTPSAQQNTDIAAVINAWVEELEEKRSAYADLPANNPNNLVGYVRSEDLIEEARELERQTREYAEFQKKVMAASMEMSNSPPFLTFRDENDTEYTVGLQELRDGTVGLSAREFEQFKERYAAADPVIGADGTEQPKIDLGAFTPPPSRDDVVSLRTKMDNHSLPDIPPGAEKASAQDGPTVKEFMDNGNAFTKALAHLHSDDFNRETFKEHLRDGFREMAENAYEEAEGPKNEDYKKRFVDQFVKDQEHYVELMANDYVDGPRGALDHKLADYALVTEHPEVLADSLRETYESGERYLRDDVVMLGDEPMRDKDGQLVYKTQPEFNTSSLSTALLLNIDSVRSRVEHMAYMNGEGLHRSDTAGGQAVAEIIDHGSDPQHQFRDQVVAKNAEKYPRAPANQYVRDEVTRTASTTAKAKLEEQVDLDGNGKVTQDEAVAYMATKMDRSFQADADKDGKISAEEAQKAKEQLLAKADLNQDGKLDASEAMKMQDTVSDRSAMLSQILSINGVEIAAITKSLNAIGMQGGDDVKVSTNDGNHVEGQTATTATGKQPSANNDLSV